MAYETLTIERRGLIALLTLNRPQRMNAMSTDFCRDLAAAAVELATDREARVIVVHGAGRCFSAGADMKESSGQTVAEYRTRREWIYRSFGAVMKLPQPTIAAVHSFALGGGFELAAACDLRVASEDAQFGYAEVKVGVTSPAQNIVRLVGLSRAKDILLTARNVGAVEAERIGLVNRLVPNGQHLDAAIELAEQIAGIAPLALRFTKIAANMALEGGFAAAAQYEIDTAVLCAGSEDRQEAVRAFAEKRKPSFRGV